MDKETAIVIFKIWKSNRTVDIKVPLNITANELRSAKEAILSGLRGVHDSPGAIENYHGTTCISGFPLTLEQYRQAVEQVEIEQAAAAARTLKYHSSFFLKGVTA